MSVQTRYDVTVIAYKENKESLGESDASFRFKASLTDPFEHIIALGKTREEALQNLTEIARDVLKDVESIEHTSILLDLEIYTKK